MEILATNYDYIPLVIAIILTLLALFVLIITVSLKDSDGILPAIVFLMFATIFYCIGIPETYDAIITDFNEVYEQGYEVVEQNGKIVTLRKVGE